MKIRKAKLKDVNECMKMEKLDKSSYWNKIDFERAIKDKLSIFLIAEDNKKIVGYILGFMCPTRITDVMIHETRVNKTLRHKRIGTKLVNEFCKIAFKKGAKDIYALIDQELVNFYIKSCKFKK